MGSFRAAINIVDPHGQQRQPIEALVDTDTCYAWIHADTLTHLGVTHSSRENS